MKVAIHILGLTPTPLQGSGLEGDSFIIIKVFYAQIIAQYCSTVQECDANEAT